MALSKLEEPGALGLTRLLGVLTEFRARSIALAMLPVVLVLILVKPDEFEPDEF